MVIFVSDNFLEHYVGGAELTTDALMKTRSPPKHIKELGECTCE